MAALRTEATQQERRVEALETELRTRPPAATIALAFELLAHEVSVGPRCPLASHLKAVLGHAELLLSRSWPATQTTPGAPLQLCWFGNDPTTNEPVATAQRL